MTKQRELILHILHVGKKHPSAEEIYFAAKAQMPKIAMGTVYNNLNALSEEGLIRRLKMPEGPDLYDMNLLPHQHAVCDCCGQIMDVCVPDLAGVLAKECGFSITDYELTVHGVCSTCNTSAVGM